MTDPSHVSCDPVVRAFHLTLATVYAHGMTSGSAAATVDNPYFLGDHALIAAAWEASCAGSGLQSSQPLAEQEEYFVAWVHGYVVRAEQIEGAPPFWENAAEGDDPSSPVVSEPLYL